MTIPILPDDEPAARALNCLNCVFYQDAGEVDPDEGPWGWCHRYPPTVVVDVADPGSRETVQCPARPYVDATEWCGEHRGRQ